VTERRRYHPSDSSNLHWRRLLSYALDRADVFECAIPYPVILQDLAHARLWPSALQPFAGELLDRHVSLIRWEISHDYATQFLRFKITPSLIRYVESFRGLERWQWELGAPEDPSFLVGDTPVLTTESANGRIAVFASAHEFVQLADNGIRLLEPLGVKAEPWPTP
jgi:hypothetical protein